MIAVLFEVIPKLGARETYLDTALQLRPLLDQMEGFISIERFQSVTNPAKMLSLSYWKSEESVSRWRNDTAHRQAQTQGRDILFEDYQIKVAQVIRHYSLENRKDAPVAYPLSHNK